MNSTYRNTMTTRLPSQKLALPGLLLLAAAATCQAGSVQLTPVRINLSDKAKVETLTVRNTGTTESVMQVTLNKWALEGKDYTYKRSQDLVITPATFRLAPGAQQIVRVGLRGKAPATKEASYRLVVEEVPSPPTPGVTGAQLVVRHDLPVFVAPVAATKASLDVSVDCTPAGSNLRVTNIGNVHAQIQNVALKGTPGDQPIARWDTSDYLLPAAQKSWTLAQAAPAAAGKPFVVTALTDQGSFTADVKTICP
jgi:fimbrial chaperone protein